MRVLAEPAARHAIVHFGLFYFGLQAIVVFLLVTPMQKSIHTKEYALFLECLRAARERAGLTQFEVASRLNATQTFVSKCERGERRLDIVELRQWCSAIETTLGEFSSRFDDACKKNA